MCVEPAGPWLSVHPVGPFGPWLRRDARHGRGVYWPHACTSCGAPRAPHPFHVSHRVTTRLDPDEDARLASLCLAGRSDAWTDLVHRHERLVYAVSRSYRLADEDLGEVFQDVFLALYQRLPYIRDTRSLCRWLSSTTERIARATALRRRREQALRVDDPHVLDTAPTDRPDPARTLEEFETQALVRLAVEDLSPRCRSLLRALYYEDPPVPYAELAAQLRLSIGSIGPTRARCFDRLRLALSKRGQGAERITTAPSPTSVSVEEGSGPRTLSPPSITEGGARHDS